MLGAMCFYRTKKNACKIGYAYISTSFVTACHGVLIGSSYASFPVTTMTFCLKREYEKTS